MSAHFEAIGPFVGWCQNRSPPSLDDKTIHRLDMLKRTALRETAEELSLELNSLSSRSDALQQVGMDTHPYLKKRIRLHFSPLNFTCST